MGVLPTQSVGTAIGPEVAPVGIEIDPQVLNDLWGTCEAEACGLTRAEFEQIVLGVGIANNFGLASGAASSDTREQQAGCFAALRMPDLVLARACARGKERAWERFVSLYRQVLLRAAIAITGNESIGRELADGLYAELYGLTAGENERRCPLDSYSGRGSLAGWLRTILAQRHVDRHRRTFRDRPLDEATESTATLSQPESLDPHFPLLAAAVEEALQCEGAEERFLLASYYLDGRRLHQIAAALGVHEATVSRKLKRTTASVRKHIVRALERKGLSRRAAEELLTADPRDLSAAEDAAGINPYQLNLKELLQHPRTATFKEQAER